jgi:hypothetical protein
VLISLSFLILIKKRRFWLGKLSLLGELLDLQKAIQVAVIILLIFKISVNRLIGEILKFS